MQKPLHKPNKTSNVELLQKHLDFPEQRVEPYGEERLVIIPVKEEFKAIRKIDNRSIPVLVLILDKDRSIRKGNLILYTPEPGSAISKIPANSFYHIYNTAEPEANGQFRFLSVTGRLLYQLDYHSKKLRSFGLLQQGAANSSTTVNVTGCTDWYLITTNYYDDGTSSQTSEYIGTTCGYCDDPINAGFCPDNEYGGSGGGSGNEVEYEFAVTKAKHWEVYREVTSGPSAFVKIGAIIQMWGKKVPSEQPQGGHFTKVSSHGTYTENFSVQQMQFYSTLDHAWYGPQHAYHEVAGTVVYPPYTIQPKQVTKTGTWDFSVIFP